MTGSRPRLLILSFSDIAADARVLKQVRLFQGDYDVVTCGFGPTPEGAAEHVGLRKDEPRAAVLLRAALIRLRAFRLAYRLTPAVREARRKLRGRCFDAVLANDLDTAGLALALAPTDRIHLDLHEYWPGLHDQDPKWRRLRLPYNDRLLRAFASRIRSGTTVSSRIARRYADEFGIELGVVMNASAFQELEPTPVGDPLRLVHSGGSQPSRRIENMMRAVAASRAATLDLYLVGAGTDYYRGLVALAGELGGRVRILDPVAPEQLIGVLNGYDVGIHVLPATNTNNALALPNKFFDYVQARLALLIGPTASMVELLEEHGLGATSSGFDVEAMTRAIDGLDPAGVRAAKAASHAAAHALSAGPQNEVWRRAIDAIAAQEGVRR